MCPLAPRYKEMTGGFLSPYGPRPHAPLSRSRVSFSPGKAETVVPGLRALGAVTWTRLRELFWFRLGMHPCR